MATDIIQYMIYGKLMPDVIIASPAYGSKKGMHEGGANMRNRDLLPFPFPGIAIPPGGAQFLKFIEKELIPFVEANFRTVAGDRTLWGYSFGGIFALYALFEKPGLFQRYIIVHGFHEKFIEVEETYASRCTDLPARVFLAGPPDEWGNDMQLLADKMKGRNYPGLHLEFEQLSNLDHFAIPAEGLTKGLISVYRKSS
jgi:pimeloyl-ACP methyl ester carboxylesterase